MKTRTRTAPEKGAQSTRLPPPPPRKRAGLPKPSAKFRAVQRRLRKLIEHGSLAIGSTWFERQGHFERRGELVEELRASFLCAFGLAKDKGRVAFRFFHRLENTDYPQFDHASYYRRGDNVFIVSQPYGVVQRELDAWSKRHGAVSWAIVDEWAHYYPGHATCFYVEFERPASRKKEAR